MSINQSGNKATTQYHTWVPNMPGFSGWDEKPFESMRTPEEQIWWLYAQVKGIIDQTDSDNLAERVTALEKQMADLLNQFAALLARMGKLESMMDSLAQNGLVYDVTKGTYAPSMPAERRMWQAQMFEGMTVTDLAQCTVEQAALYNVRHVAVDGRTEYMGLPKAAPEMPWQDGWTEADFRPDAYVKKSDLTLIDTDNLADHTIMGVLKSVAATVCPTPTPYMRKGTVTDLKHLIVRSDDVLMTDND
jgi:hypothetical protein